MPNKMTQCKTCGADIAKSANRCPHCGARQHTGAHIACALIIVAAVALCAVILGSSGSNISAQKSGTVSSEPDTISFSGGVYSAEYVKCQTVSGVNGCFYITLKIANTGDVECTYLLDDVYVDDTHCQSGSGLPITALPGKNVNGAFIVFCETPLENVSKVEFRLKVMNSENLDTIETSDTISVVPNS